MGAIDGQMAEDPRVQFNNCGVVDLDGLSSGDSFHISGYGAGKKIAAWPDPAAPLTDEPTIDEDTL